MDDEVLYDVFYEEDYVGIAPNYDWCLNRGEVIWNLLLILMRNAI